VGAPHGRDRLAFAAMGRSHAGHDVVPFPLLHRIRWALVPLLGVIASLGYAPYGQWYLTVLALALVLALAARATSGQALLLGWVYGFAHFLTGIYWVYISTHVYGGAPAWLGALLTVALCGYLAAYPALALWLASRLGLLQSAAGWVGVPALWVLLELVRGRVIFAGMPWLSLGELSVDTPLSRLLPLVGVHGISAVLALVAFALYRLGVEHDARRRIVARRRCSRRRSRCCCCRGRRRGPSRMARRCRSRWCRATSSRTRNGCRRCATRRCRGTGGSRSRPGQRRSWSGPRLR
jgi:hypothetical protein